MEIMKKSVLAGEKGIAAVEFALVLPLLVTLLFGIIEFGLVMYNKQVITNASREGARAGIVLQDPRIPDPNIQTIVNQYALNHLVSFGATPETPQTVVGHTGQNFGNDLTVTVTYQYRFLVISAFIPGLGNSLQLTAQTVMKYE